MIVITKSHIDENHANSQYFPEAESEDGLFSWNSMSPDSVSIDCAKTELEDNTRGKTGRHVVCLQYPDGIDKNLLQKARDFRDTIEAIREERRNPEPKKDQGIVSHDNSYLCPNCNTVCYGDCQDN